MELRERIKASSDKAMHLAMRNSCMTPLITSLSSLDVNNMLTSNNHDNNISQLLQHHSNNLNEFIISQNNTQNANATDVDADAASNRYALTHT